MSGIHNTWTMKHITNKTDKRIRSTIHGHTPLIAGTDPLNTTRENSVPTLEKLLEPGKVLKGALPVPPPTIGVGTQSPTWISVGLRHSQGQVSILQLGMTHTCIHAHTHAGSN